LKGDDDRDSLLTETSFEEPLPEMSLFLSLASVPLPFGRRQRFALFLSPGSNDQSFTVTIHPYLGFKSLDYGLSVSAETPQSLKKPLHGMYHPRDSLWLSLTSVSFPVFPFLVDFFRYPAPNDRNGNVVVRTYFGLKYVDGKRSPLTEMLFEELLDEIGVNEPQLELVIKECLEGFWRVGLAICANVPVLCEEPKAFALSDVVGLIDERRKRPRPTRNVMFSPQLVDATMTDNVFDDEDL
jgi:hypothetical protein